MSKLLTYGSVGGAPGNRCIYPEHFVALDLFILADEDMNRGFSRFRLAVFTFSAWYPG